MTPGDLPDSDPVETREWLDSVDAVVESDGRERMGFLLDQTIDHAQEYGVKVSAGLSTPYVNTIPVDEETPVPGDPELERLATALVRWNAIAIVLQANAESTALGGHIASYASAATLYDVGFNHFLRARSDGHSGDLVYIQGHSSPGIYARAFLEGRLGEDQLRRFRQEVDGDGLSSYPHPWLMPDFWQFPTVSMGLGPLMAIYQARFMKYLDDRGVVDPGDRKVWAFIGDGETDEPESMGAISLAGREKLDNLVFVVNCNLQRLDGPVRGNGKIIQELETNFRGAGWNVIKVIWGSGWDPLLEADTTGWLRNRMEEAVDGEYQAFKSTDGAYMREHFFGKYPEPRAMVADGATTTSGSFTAVDTTRRRSTRPTPTPWRRPGARPSSSPRRSRATGRVRPARGRTSPTSRNDGRRGAARVSRSLRPPADDEQATGAFYFPPPDSPEIRYMHERREALGGYLPVRRTDAEPLAEPPLGRSRPCSRAPAIARCRRRWRSCGSSDSLTRDKKIGRARRADRARRVADLRHGGDVPAARDLLPGRPALPARRRRPGRVLPGGEARPDPAGGDQRGRGVARRSSPRRRPTRTTAST